MKRLSFDAVLAARLSRRAVVSGAAATVGLAACAHVPTQRASGASAPSFTSIAPQSNDAFTIADGYRYNLVARWGDSLVTGTRDFDTARLAADAWLDTDSVQAQERQFGTNADAVAYFAQKS
ncbi:MAG TPA: alkaline phosphatase PhoX, partial [Steroidobacteraceae bacterium]|nr:alkaline phosphatase PhoX [Steroidobacteraceae bacterium]